MNVLSQITSSPLLLIATIVVAMIGIGALKHAVTRGRLRYRQSFGDEEFGRTFFQGARADTAIRVRRVLAENLDADLGGVRPDDRLDDDLDASIESNVNLFFELESEFDIDTGVDNLEVFESNVEGLVTFSDLVEFAHRKRSDPTSRRKPEPISDDEFEAWDAIGYAWFAGIGLSVVAGMVDSDGLMKAALTIAFLPITIGIITQLVFAFRELGKEIRANGLSDLRSHPFSVVIWLAVVTPFALAAAWFAWVLFSIYFRGE